MYFTYGEKELDFLRQKDKRLAEVIDRIGPVHRTVDTDLFSAVVHHIIGQQISTKAQATIWQRMCDALGTVHAKTVLGAVWRDYRRWAYPAKRQSTSPILPKRCWTAALI